MSHTFKSIPGTECTFMHDATSATNTSLPHRTLSPPAQSADILDRTQYEVYADTA